MTVFVVGGRGWLGSELRAILPDSRSVSAADLLEFGARTIPAAAAAGESVIVNVAGARHGDSETLRRLNTGVPRLLAELSLESGVRVVHLGSAAEYGVAANSAAGGGRLLRSQSEYGRTKLAGSQALLATGLACVLRPFNIASGPPQPGTPLEDVLERVRRASVEQRHVELLSAATARDWVSKSFVVSCVMHAVEADVVGSFDVCSGHATTMGELAAALIRELGDSARGVRDLGAVPASAVVGSPHEWREVTGMAERLSSAELARLVLEDPSRLTTEHGEGEGR